jgi:hypothetical protein
MGAIYFDSQADALNGVTRADRQRQCQHLTGYWINKRKRNFRCYQCQCQFHIGDNLPANHPTGGIEVWRAR